MIPNIHESETQIRQRLGLQGRTNPDLFVGNDFVDVKSPFNVKNMVRNANAAFSQGAYACITDHLFFTALGVQFLKKLITFFLS